MTDWTGLPDRLCEVLFEHVADAVYILDRDRYRYLAVNPAFAELTGWSQEELEADDFDPTRLVDPDDRPAVRALDRDGPPHEGRVEFRLLPREGPGPLCELTYRNLEVDGIRIRVGSIRPIPGREEEETDLEAEVRRERQSKEFLVEKNIQLFELTERIQRVPVLTTALLKADSEMEVYRTAGEHLIDRDGMNFAVAAFYAREDSTLALRHATMDGWEESIDPAEIDGLSDVLSGDASLHEGPPGNFFLPLQGHDEPFGVLQAFLHRRARDILAENPAAITGLREVLCTVADTIGLVLESLRLMARIRRQSTVDQLTGVYNRRYLDRKVADEVQRTRRYGRAMSLIIADIDEFKEINDSYGHPQGDEVIRGVAEILQENTREVDVTCRYGGDEFVVIFPEMTASQARKKAESLRRLIRETAFSRIDGEGELQVTVSLGVAALDGDGDAQELFRRADEALYQAKRSGRNVVKTA